jgi:hypothetical protein
MTNVQMNLYTMYLVVITVLDKFEELIKTIPALLNEVTDFKGIVAQIGDIMETTKEGTKNKTSVKHSAESIMASAVVEIVGKLYAYAEKNGLQELAAKTNIAESTIHDTRDGERALYAESLVKFVEDNKAALATEYAVTDEQIAAVKQTITNYRKSLGDRSSTATGNASHREIASGLFKRADKIIATQFEPLIRSMRKDHPEFYLEFQAAAMPRDIAATHEMKENGTPAAATNDSKTAASSSSSSVLSPVATN